MSEASKDFEKQIHRIHKLIEQPGSDVTWNDHVIDPDNPDQARQIDITIRRDDRVTYVECRAHKEKQDVNWIEELIGRKQSLRVDAIIAVSASGFTSGAIKKAEKYGVILRDMVALTKEEIKNWGHSTKVWFTFYQYYETTIKLVVDLAQTSAKTFQEVYALITKERIIYKTFDTVKTFLNQRNLADTPGRETKVKYRFALDKSNFKDIVIKEIIFRSKVKALIKSLYTPAVVVYDNPRTPPIERGVFVEKVDFGKSEITQFSNDVSAVIDLTFLKNPRNAQFNSIRFDFVDPISFKNIHFLGLKNFAIPMKKLKLEIECVE